jgi:hypothetical protein
MNPRPRTLLLSNSIDYTTDLVVQTLGTENVFRFNADLWEDYQLSIDDNGIELVNPSGLKVTDAEIVKVYRRSNVRASTLYPDKQYSQEQLLEEEVWTALNDLMNLFWREGKVVLTQPWASLRVGKLQQARLAQDYFQAVPDKFLINSPSKLDPVAHSVVKSFSFKFKTGIGFYSRLVPEGDLDPAHPWYITDFIDATHDVTVAFVRDSCFAFELDRRPFLEKTIDWRQAPEEYAHRNWESSELPDEISNGIAGFMKHIGGHYARIDFLRKGDRFVFLEANFTGEWAWLDAEGKHGLRDKIIY